MRSFKSVFGVIGSVLYCGGLLYYFLDLGETMHDAWTVGLGPIMLGLGAVGVLFRLPQILKAVRLLAALRSPGSGGHGRTADDDRESGFDVDAAIARYMAQRTAETVPNVRTAAPANKTTGPARPGFGRRGR